VRALFPDKRNVLHLFSGKVDLAALPGDTVDINATLSPTYVDDAQTLKDVPLDRYDLVLADPPYSVEDADRYQTTMVKRNAVLRALQRVTPGTHIVWLDQVLPMYRKDAFVIDAVIGMVKSTNHRFRVITVFRRRENQALNRKASVQRAQSAPSLWR
jgi:16S rRNA G966 N2-methylase RsmD